MAAARAAAASPPPKRPRTLFLRSRGDAIDATDVIHALAATNSDSDTPLQELPSTPLQPHMTPDTRRKVAKIVQNRPR
eukprot:gene16344-17981_t